MALTVFHLTGIDCAASRSTLSTHFAFAVSNTFPLLRLESLTFEITKLTQELRGHESKVALEWHYQTGPFLALSTLSSAENLCNPFGRFFGFHYPHSGNE